MANEMTLEDLARRFDDLDRRFDDLKTHMDVRFEATHRLIRIGLEWQEIQRESMERRFDAMESKENGRFELLTAVARHLRVRIESVESRDA